MIIVSAVVSGKIGVEVSDKKKEKIHIKTISTAQNQEWP